MIMIFKRKYFILYFDKNIFCKPKAIFKKNCKRQIINKYFVSKILKNNPCVWEKCYTGWRKKNAWFSYNCKFLYFQYKKIMSTPKQPVINASLITYNNYSITENYVGKMASILPYTLPEPLLKVLHHIYLPAISFFGVTSNQKTMFENLVQSTIWKFPFAKKLRLYHKKC